MKGFAYTLEAVIAVVILLITTVFLFSSQPQNDIDLLKARGYEAVAHLDARGDLRKLVDANDVAAIKQRLSDYVENFDAEICAPQCAGTARQGVAVVDWHVSGYFSNYAPKQLRVYLFED